MPEPGQIEAPASAIVRIPGIGGLRLLHCTHGDHAEPVVNRTPHRHDLWHCVVYAHGKATCIHDGAVVPVTAPYLVLTNPGQFHSFSRAAGEDAVYHEITFAPERPAALAGWDGLLQAWTGTSCTVAGHGPCSAACSADIGSIAARMGGIIQRGSAHAAVLLQGLLAEVLLVVFQHGVAEVERQAPGDPLDAARRFIEAHAEDAIDLGTVAKAASLSAKHLGRAFAARYGQPPMRYRRSVLMRRAAILLRTSDAPIERLANQLGYGDWRFFSRCFTSMHGVSPAAYRRGEPTRS